MDAYIALIAIFAGGFNPKNWALCQGQLISISTNQALFAVLGTTYGGNGQNTFALPDLRGRVPVGVGQGPGLQQYYLGQMGGTETHTMLINEMPAHNHTAVLTSVTVSPSASTAPGTTNIPDATMVPAKLPSIGSGPTAQPIKGYAVADNTTTLAPSTASGNVTIGISGGQQPFSIQSPYLALNYIICLYGIFPSRN